MKKSLLVVNVIGMVVLLAATFGVATPVKAQTIVFINEIHYDNTSTDAGEAVEIAGPAGTDLTGWSIVLYNGSNGAVYNTDELSGTIPDLGGGYGVVVLTYPLNGLQNGSPDGLTLVDDLGAVVQFLSYEGTFVAVGGPAGGMTSVDIGVSESSGTAAGDSLQLTGVGIHYEDFSWDSGTSDSFGSVNTDQSFIPGSGLTDPVLNEFVFNHSGSDVYEYVEVYGDADTDYSTFTVVEIEGDGSSAGLIDDGTLTIGMTNTSGLWTTGFQDNLWENGSVTLLLVEGYSGSVGYDIDIDNDGLLDFTPWDRIVDSVAVTDGEPGDQVYSGIVLAGGFDGVSFPPGGASRIPNGMDTDSIIDWVRNDFDLAGLPGFIGTLDLGEALNTPEIENALVPVVVNDIFINEIRIDQPGSDNDEYFELVGPARASLGGLTYLVIGDGSDGSGVIETVVDLNASFFPVSGYFLVAEGSFSLATPTLTTSINFENSDNVTHLLVRGFSGASGMDLDTDDDGNLDLLPWDEELDRIALIEEENPPGGTEFHYGPPSVGPDGLFVPGHVYKCPNGWNIGGFSAGSNDTPGTDNECPTILINEVRIDQPGSDVDEYFELAGLEGASLDSLTYLVIGDGPGGSGVIEAVVPLTGQAIQPDGYFSVGESAHTLGSIDHFTTLNFENSDNVTHLLVSGFSGSSGDDIDVDDDGTLDSTPWLEIFDSVALVETPGAGEKVYSPNQIGPDGTFVPGHIYRCPGSWLIGVFDPAGGYDTPGSVNDCFAACGAPAVMIHQVQGDGLASPIAGESGVVLEGVVTGDYQDTTIGLSGFFMQEEDVDADGSPTTSEGIFVYDNGFLDVNEGDFVRVEGTVTEFYDLTEISPVTNLVICGQGGVVTATEAGLPISDSTDFEQFEGMKVIFPQDLFISEYFNFDRYGEVVLTSERQFQPTSIYDPGSAAAANLAQDNQLGRITLDDGRSESNPDPALHPAGGIFDLTNRFRGSDRIVNLIAVMDYAFGEYRLQPVSGGEYVDDNLRPPNPDPVGGEIRVASFNVLNYFTTLGSRGADTLEEFERQRTKIFAAITAIDADVVGLIEIENNGTAVSNLVDGLNGLVGAGTYDYVDTKIVGEDEITVAFIYKPASVSLAGGFAVLDDPSFTDPLGYGEQKSRPALAQTFEANQDGALFTVVVNHFKSKGTPCGSGDDDPETGSCNLTRTLGAQALVDWLEIDPTDSKDPDFLIIGDLNAYDKEDPIDVLVNAGYTDLVMQHEGEYAFSYVFDGQLGYLDHSLSNLALTSQVTGLDIWHINADEPDILDYDTSFKQDAQDALYEPNAYRSSDHDPVIVGLDLNVAPVCTEAYASIDLLWPVNHKFVALEVFDVTDADGDVLTYIIDDIFQDEEVDDGGDGNTAPDGIIGDGNAFELRAERAGDGNGRVYHVYFTASDGRGGTCSGEVLVSVPHDQGKNADPPVDDGALYDSTAEPEVAAEVVEEALVEPTPEPTPEPTAEPDVAVTPEPIEVQKDKDTKDK